MKRYVIEITVVGYTLIVVALLGVIAGHNKRHQRELNAAYERGVRWGERERKHLVVFEGVTNKYDTINEAMSNAVSGASIYLAAGIHYVGPHGMAVPALDNLSVYGSTNDTLTDARGKRIGTTINAEWSGVTNNAVEKKEP